MILESGWMEMTDGPSRFKSIIDPIVENNIDHVKGNRFMTGKAFDKIPKVRYFGNVNILLTKNHSGYWHIADSQSGYTSCNKSFKTIKWRNV